MRKLTLLQRVQDEADLCRNEGASDIAALLDEVAAALEQPTHERAGYNARPSYSRPPPPPAPPAAPAHLSADDVRQVQRLFAALRDQAVSNQTHIEQLAGDVRLLQGIAKAAAALCDAAEEVECENGLGLWAQHGQWEPLHEALEAMSAAPEPTP